MSPLDPLDALGTNHTVAALLLAADAMADHVRAMAAQAGETRHRPRADDFDHALVGLVAVSEHLRRIAGDSPGAAPIPPRTVNGRVLR